MVEDEAIYPSVTRRWMYALVAGQRASESTPMVCSPVELAVAGAVQTSDG